MGRYDDEGDFFYYVYICIYYVRLISRIICDYRLCSDVEVSKQVVELEGVNRLIKLCKEERERNHSDGVLVACLVSQYTFHSF